MNNEQIIIAMPRNTWYRVMRSLEEVDLDYYYQHPKDIDFATRKIRGVLFPAGEVLTADDVKRLIEILENVDYTRWSPDHHTAFERFAEEVQGDETK